MYCTLNSKQIDVNF